MAHRMWMWPEWRRFSYVSQKPIIANLKHSVILDFTCLCIIILYCSGMILLWSLLSDGGEIHKSMRQQTCVPISAFGNVYFRIRRTSNFVAWIVCLPITQRRSKPQTKITPRKCLSIGCVKAVLGAAGLTDRKSPFRPFRFQSQSAQTNSFTFVGGPHCKAIPKIQKSKSISVNRLQREEEKKHRIIFLWNVIYNERFIAAAKWMEDINTRCKYALWHCAVLCLHSRASI